MSFSDNFDRANSTTTLGAPWTALKGTWGISNNQAYLVTPDLSNDSFAVVDAGASDGHVQATIGVTPLLFNYPGLVFRVSNASNFWEVAHNTGTGNWELYTYSGSYTGPLATGVGTAVQGDVVRVEMSGTNITLKVNGSTVLTYSGAFNQTATQHGLYFFAASVEGRWDDFSAGSTVGTFTPPIQSNGVPPTLPEGDPDQHILGYRLFRYYSARPGGDGNNVYYRIVSRNPEVGEVTNVDPYTTYDSEGNVLVDGWSDVAHVWWAGHAPEEVTPAQATALISGGYTVI